MQHTVLVPAPAPPVLPATCWAIPPRSPSILTTWAPESRCATLTTNCATAVRKTECEIDANGVLTGTSKKVYRGTIDLVHGCKGATGTERETVLLANKGVDNKTVPVILCDEDDVAGNHGATIGHVRNEQLFYLACRGLDQNAAEDLFVRAKLEGRRAFRHRRAYPRRGRPPGQQPRSTTLKRSSYDRHRAR